jgi:hypothetical protein
MAERWKMIVGVDIVAGCEFPGWCFGLPRPLSSRPPSR